MLGKATYILLILSLRISIVFILKLYSKLTLGICKTNTCLVGKTAIVTGGNEGIGYQVALGLAARGCRVIIADKDDSDNSRKKIIECSNNPNIISKKFDLSSVESIQSLAKDILETEDRLDILINNAGCISFGNRITEDGMNFLMQVNHFGPFLLTHLLIDLLKKTPQSKLIFTSSCASFMHRLTKDNANNPKIYKQEIITDLLVYANSKMCALISARYFAEKLKPFGIVSNAAYPGIVYTNIVKMARKSSSNASSIFNKVYFYVFDTLLLGFFGKTPQEGAQTTLHLATTNDNITGKYFVDCGPSFFTPSTKNKQLCEGVIKETLKVLKLDK